MSENLNKKNSFIYNGQTLYYLMKDIERIERRGKEMAKAIMLVFDENHIEIDFFAVYDEGIKVMYAMPSDAERWYENYKTS